MKETDEYIQFNDLNKYNEIIHFYSKKPFNFSNKISDNVIVEEYNQYEELLKYSCYKKIKPNQTHSNNVIVVDKNNINNYFENTDGLITNLKGYALITSSADCQAILLYDPIKNVIGNIHSGWKGTLNRIIYKAINLMIDRFNSNVKDIKVYICPSILQKCFEVDEDVVSLFINNYNDIDINKYINKDNTKNKYYIDTVSINIGVMINMGIDKENIFKSNICTKCNNDKFYSHRSDIETDGRNIALIMLKQ